MFWPIDLRIGPVGSRKRRVPAHSHSREYHFQDRPTKTPNNKKTRRLSLYLLKRYDIFHLDLVSSTLQRTTLLSELKLAQSKELLFCEPGPNPNRKHKEGNQPSKQPARHGREKGMPPVTEEACLILCPLTHSTTTNAHFRNIRHNPAEKSKNKEGGWHLISVKDFTCSEAWEPMLDWILSTEMH